MMIEIDESLSPPETPVFFAFQPFIGGTEEEARRQRDELVQRVPLKAALAPATKVSKNVAATCQVI